MSNISIFPLLGRLRFNASHYNSITEAWKYIFGDNFHLGYFSSPDVSLDEATDALIEKMADLAEFTDHSNVLDVGCGIGNPAFYLHRKFGSDITGITTSEIGVHQATQRSQDMGYQDKVRFRVANGLDNGFDDESFDIVWVMESSHLMKDKKKLLAECRRVLKPGGVMLLCDVMKKRPFTMADRIDYIQRMKFDYVTASIGFIRSFGLFRMETFETYQNFARDVGFDEVAFIDITEEVFPTYDCWKANIATHQQSILQTLTPSQIDGFIQATDMAKDLCLRNIGGYGILKAARD